MFHTRYRVVRAGSYFYPQYRPWYLPYYRDCGAACAFDIPLAIEHAQRFAALRGEIPPTTPRLFK